MVRSDLDGCGKFLKYSMFFVNFLIFIGGFIVCGLGIWTLVDSKHVEKIMGEDLYFAAAGLLVAFGGIVAFISFLGCCGAIKEVKCLLGTFFVIMFLLTIVIILGAAFAFVTKDKLETGLKDGLKETMKVYGQNEASKPITEAWDEVQKEFKCCGANSYVDWKAVPKFQEGLSFPDSCCITSGCNILPTPVKGTYYDQGCYEGVKEYVEKHAKPLAIIAIVVAVVIILSMIFSCALCLMI